MRRALTLLFFLLISNQIIASNTVVAIVNDNLITLDSISWQLVAAKTNSEKMEVLNQQIDLLLQLNVARELGINPKNNEIEGALLQLAQNNNISFKELKLHPEYELFVNQIWETLSIIKLEQFITKDLKSVDTSEKILSNCSNVCLTNIKQIKIAQIIISEVLDSDSPKNIQENAVIELLQKLSKHISKGASFETIAKLHSQHSSYFNGGLSEWLYVNNPTIEMFDSLNVGEVSKIYETEGGWAIAMKVDERIINTDFETCKEKFIKQNSEKYYSEWLKELRDSAYIEIYADKL